MGSCVYNVTLPHVKVCVEVHINVYHESFCPVSDDRILDTMLGRNGCYFLL